MDWVGIIGGLIFLLLLMGGYWTLKQFSLPRYTPELPDLPQYRTSQSSAQQIFALEAPRLMRTYNQQPDEEILPYQAKQPFLSDEIQNVLNILQPLCQTQGYQVFVKINLESLVQLNTQQVPNPQAQQLMQERLQQHEIDFVLCDLQNWQVQAVLLLTPTSLKNGEKMQARFINAALNAAKIPYFHLPHQNTYSVIYLQQILQKKLGLKIPTLPCPLCGEPLRPVMPKKGQLKDKLIWLCKQYPQCRGFKKDSF